MPALLHPQQARHEQGNTRFQMQTHAVSDAGAHAVSDAEVTPQANNDGHLRKRNSRARVLTF